MTAEKSYENTASVKKVVEEGNTETVIYDENTNSTYHKAIPSTITVAKNAVATLNRNGTSTTVEGAGEKDKPIEVKLKDTIKYTITVTVTGDNSLPVTITDIIPKGLTLDETADSYTEGMDIEKSQVSDKDSETTTTVRWGKIDESNTDELLILAPGSHTFEFKTQVVKYNTLFENSAKITVPGMTLSDDITNSNYTYHKSKVGVIKVTVPTEYLFAGVPNVSDKILSPNYKIENHTEDGKIKVEVAGFTPNAISGTENDFTVGEDEGKGVIGLKIEKINDTKNGTGFGSDSGDMTSGILTSLSNTDTKVFELGTLGAPPTNENDTSVDHIGFFKFVGDVKGYDVLDMDLNEHAKFKMILRFSIVD